LLAQTKSEFFSVVRDLRGQGKNYGGLLSVQPVEFAQLQKQLPADTLLVQYYPTADKLYYFVISHDGFKVRTLDQSKAQLYGWIRDFRKMCKSFALSEAALKPFDWSSGAGQQLLARLNELHSALIQPLAEDLQGHKVLAVIPTEYLLYLPFPALAQPVQGKPHFLIEDVAVVTLLHATDLSRLGKESLHSSDRLLALGNPDGT
ncbi:unnamed protein product, partial [Phaeothamnion confervicola]